MELHSRLAVPRVERLRCKRDVVGVFRPKQPPCEDALAAACDDQLSVSHRTGDSLDYGHTFDRGCETEIGGAQIEKRLVFKPRLVQRLRALLLRVASGAAAHECQQIWLNGHVEGREFADFQARDGV